MEPFLSPNRVAGMLELVREATSDMLGRWAARPQPDGPLNVTVEMLRLGLDITTRALYHADAVEKGYDLVRASETLLDHVYSGTRTYFSPPEWLPIPSVRRFMNVERIG